MIDCPVCTRTQIAGDSCPQCGADLKPLLRFAELRNESQKPTPPQRRNPPAVAIATFAVGLAIVPVWQKLHPPPGPIAVNPPKTVTPPPVAPSAEKLYTVRTGDSFWSIAKEKYGMGVMWKNDSR